MDETTLIVAAVIVGGVAIYGLTKPVGQSLNDVTGVIPWAQDKVDDTIDFIRAQKPDSIVPWILPFNTLINYGAYI